MEKETVFDYHLQKILVDLDYGCAKNFGDMLHGYYRIGLLRHMFKKSNIIAKINPRLINFYFREADFTIHSFDAVKYENFDIISRHAYNASAIRQLWGVHKKGADFPLQEDPNNRDFRNPYEIHRDIYRLWPRLMLRGSTETATRVSSLFTQLSDYDNFVYVNFRDYGGLNERRNFSDENILLIVSELAKCFPKVLFIVHTFKRKWLQKALRENIFPLAALDGNKVAKINIENDRFFSWERTDDELVDFRICNEILFHLIEQSMLFITAGNSGFGCFAQYAHPNMLCFVALRELHWITHKDKYYKYVRKEEYSDFSVEEIINTSLKSVGECVENVEQG